jgi:uncharacterized protein YjiS (DUF1127 family)
MSCGSTQCSQTLSVSSLQTLEIPAPFAGWGSVCWRFAGRLLRFYDRQLQRRALLELDDHMLADIGVTREQAAAEGRKPVWLSAQRAFTISN